MAPIWFEIWATATQRLLTFNQRSQMIEIACWSLELLIDSLRGVVGNFIPAEISG